MKRRTPLKRSSRPLKRTKLKAVSAKRRKEMAVYADLRAKHMKENPMCFGWLRLNGFGDEEIRNIQEIAVIALWQGMDVPPIPARRYDLMALYGLPQYCPRSFDLHHAKRRGKHYLDASSYMALSRSCHQFTHDNPKIAREAGLLA